jgi:hypothetical protein
MSIGRRERPPRGGFPGALAARRLASVRGCTGTPGGCTAADMRHRPSRHRQGNGVLHGLSTMTTPASTVHGALGTGGNGGKQWAAERWRRWKRGGRPILQRWKRGGRLVETVEGVEKPDGGRAVERGSFHRLKSHMQTRHSGLAWLQVWHTQPSLCRGAIEIVRLPLAAVVAPPA